MENAKKTLTFRILSVVLALLCIVLLFFPRTSASAAKQEQP